MARRFAEDTAVPVARSRAEIDALLRNWKCDAISWTDDFKSGEVRLQFVWSRADVRYAARLAIRMPTRDDVMRKFNVWSDRGIDRQREQAWRALHRVLLIWLKGCFNAVDSGIVSAETIFLPFLLDTDGRTVAEVALPRLERLLTEAADRLMIEGPSATNVNDSAP